MCFKRVKQNFIEKYTVTLSCFNIFFERLRIFAKAFEQFDSRNKKFHQFAGNYPFTFFFTRKKKNSNNLRIKIEKFGMLITK